MPASSARAYGRGRGPFAVWARLEIGRTILAQELAAGVGARHADAGAAGLACGLTKPAVAIMARTNKRACLYRPVADIVPISGNASCWSMSRRSMLVPTHQPEHSFTFSQIRYAQPPRADCGELHSATSARMLFTGR